MSMLMSSSGTITEMETPPLLTMEEAISAMSQAGEVVGVYQPPGRSEKSGH